MDLFSRLCPTLGRLKTIQGPSSAQQKLKSRVKKRGGEMGFPAQPGISFPSPINACFSKEQSWEATGRDVPALSVPLAAARCWLWVWGSPEAEHDLVVAQVGVVVDGQDGLGLDLVPGQETVVEAVLLRAHHLRGGRDIYGAEGPRLGVWGLGLCQGRAPKSQSISWLQQFPSAPAMRL